MLYHEVLRSSRFPFWDFHTHFSNLLIAQMFVCNVYSILFFALRLSFSSFCIVRIQSVTLYFAYPWSLWGRGPSEYVDFCLQNKNNPKIQTRYSMAKGNQIVVPMVDNLNTTKNMKCFQEALKVRAKLRSRISMFLTTAPIVDDQFIWQGDEKLQCAQIYLPY